MAEGPTVAAVIVAAGSGKRFGSDGTPKQYRELSGLPLLGWSIRALTTHSAIGRVVVALPPHDARRPPDWLTHWPVETVAGGAERGDSVRNALASLDDSVDYVLVHDGARPLLSHDLIDRLVDAARQGPVIPGIPVSDTLKEVDAAGVVVGTVDRRRLWSVQTPQAFPLATLRECHLRAAGEGVSQTDDAALLERYGIEVRVIPGDPLNLKVTTPEDFQIAEALARRLPPPPRPEGDRERNADATRI